MVLRFFRRPQAADALLFLPPDPAGTEYRKHIKEVVNMATLKPLNDRIVVKAVAAEEKTAGGIILPDAAQEKPLEAEVIAVGPGKTLDNGKVVTLEVKPGDRVIYGKYAGTEIKLGGEEYVILRQDDILAIKE
jgi:chaperonin GroES